MSALEQLKEKNQALEQRVEKLEQRFENPPVSRRAAIAGGAGILGLSALSGSASAGSNQVGTIGTNSDPVDIEAEDINAENIRLATGQAIKDGGGTDRIEIKSARTSVQYEDGTFGLNLTKGNFSGLNAYSNTSVGIYDKEANKPAVKYIASASPPGTFRMSNSILQAHSDIAGLTIEFFPSRTGNGLAGFGTNGAGDIYANDENGNTTVIS